MPVIAGAGSNSTSEAVDFTQPRRRRSAPTAVLVVTPYYNKPTQEGLYQHFKAINDAVDIPIIIYNIPGRSVVDMSVDTMTRCFALKNVIGVKDATANLARASQQRAAMGPDFISCRARTPRRWASWRTAATAAFRSTSNVAPRLCADFQNACLAGDFKTALALQDRLMPLHDALFMRESIPAR